MKPMIRGQHTFEEDGEFDGMIGGNATVKSGVSITLSGMVGGNLTVEADAHVTLTGMVGGKVLGNGTVS